MKQVNATHDTLIESAREHARNDPERNVFDFLKFHSRSDEVDVLSITRGQLDQRARSIAVHLLQNAQPGDRAVLLYPQGLEFICALLGCMYAGVIAVPSPVPRFGLGTERLRSIVADSNANLVLTTPVIQQDLNQTDIPVDQLTSVITESVDVALADEWENPGVNADTIALIQYSSGSTGAPKGVMIRQRNLVHQAAMLAAQLSFCQDSCMVSWLPTFHDMGLVLPVVSPLYTGFHAVLMAPDAFIIKPLRWLQAMSDYRADYTVAPDFSYEMCTRKIDAEERKSLDLSHWKYAGNSAEPIRARTIENFVNSFSECGFPRDAFYPAYGLAEATLLVTGRNRQVRMNAFDIDALARNSAQVVERDGDNARMLVSSGSPSAGTSIKIVDPDTCIELPEQSVGEVWVNGGSVAAGYWGKEKETTVAFNALLENSSERLEQKNTPAERYLRTGDLGFMRNGELYICGRIKDLILIRGSNHHAADIELTVENCHPALALAGGAVFSIDSNDQERLVVVYELDRSHKDFSAETCEEIAQAIRRSVTEQHEISVDHLILLRRGLPKTTSGKVRRHECRLRYLAGDFNAVYHWQAAKPDERPSSAAAPEPQKSTRYKRLCTKAERWLVSQFATQLGRQEDAIDLDQKMTQLGLNTTHMSFILRTMEKDFGFGLAATVFSDFPSIRALAANMANYMVNSDSFEPSSGGRLTVDQLDFSLDEQKNSAHSNEPIAIIGMACRFPGATGPEQFWQNLCAGMDAVTEVPDTRWDIDAVYDENPLAVGKMNTRWGGFLDDIELFDRNFFQLSIREVTRMDPAHRLLLECSWESFEDAGVTPASLEETNTGVFIGISGSDYAQLQFGDETQADAYAGIGSALTNAASRISHFLNLRGPALAVDTACSSSLSSVHMACNSIRSGECKMALAGGVNILLSPVVTMSLTKAGMMAPDGRCKTFDSRANGYVRSEGVGLVLLKPVSEAVADGDSIYAVIRGSASNQDGKSSGISAPNGEAQQKVVMAACANAGVAPGQLNYVEAHGTGTALGDPIEVNALGEVLKIGAEPDTYCRLGSVKTNIGHAESAAGIASLIKAALILHHRQIPPSLHFEEPNPLIPFDTYRVRVQTELGPLPELSRPALIGVNSFGVGGTNVHLVLEQPSIEAVAPAELPSPMPPQRPYVLPLSANSVASVQAHAQKLAAWLQESERSDSLLDVFHTLTQRRAHLDHRLAVVGADAAELADALETYVNAGHSDSAFYGYTPGDTGAAPKVAFVYSGQGSQWWAMGRQLFEKEPLYRAFIERCDAELKPHTGWSLIDVLSADESDSLLNETQYAQPAIFALQCGVTEVLKSWGIVPDAIVGHSIGEISAAYVAGALDFSDACKLVAVRASLMQQATGAGRMASIKMEREALEAELESYPDTLAIAAINSPDTIVVSGDPDAMESLLDKLQDLGVISVSLPVNYAFHSQQMEPFKLQLIDALASIKPRPAKIPLVSTVTGDWCGERLLDAAYWGDNLRQKVMFSKAIETLAADDTKVFLEIGPHPVIGGNISRTLNAATTDADVLSSLDREVDDQRALLHMTAMLYTCGVSADWTALHAGGGLCRELPHYSWDRQRFWLDGPHIEARQRLCAHPLLSMRMPVAMPCWLSRLDANVHQYFKGLRVNGRTRLPYGLFIEVALAAAYEKQPEDCVCHLQDVAISETYYLGADNELPQLQTVVANDDSGHRHIKVFAQADDSKGKAETWSKVLDIATVVDKAVPHYQPQPLDIKALQHASVDALSSKDIYSKLTELRYEYDDTLQVIDALWLADGAVLISLRENELTDPKLGSAYRLHPLVFEAMEQACNVAIGSDAVQFDMAGMKSLRVLRRDRPAAYAYARVRDADDIEQRNESRIQADVWIADHDGDVLAVLEGAYFRQQLDAGHDHQRIPENPEDWLYDIEWREEALPEISASASDANAWLVCADSGGTGDAVAAWLRDKGQQCFIVRTGNAYAQLDDQEFTVSVNDPDDFRHLLQAIFPNDGPACRGIVHCWSLDSKPLETTDLDSIESDQSLGVVSVLNLIKAVVGTEMLNHPRLWLVSGGAQPAGDANESIQITQTPMWGLGKGIAIEHAELRCCRVDLSQTPQSEETTGLCMEIWGDQVADQVALRGAKRYVAHLQYHRQPEQDDDAMSSTAPEPSGKAYQLMLVGDGESVTVEQAKSRRGSPGPGEIEVRVHAAGLGKTNPGMLLNSGTGSVGLAMQQCAGTVTRVGMGVQRFESGDTVVALVTANVGSHVIINADSAAAIPDSVSLLQATHSVRPYLSAFFALHKLASLQKGQKILIHGADGAMGMAAVQVAKLSGARVFATAQSEQRRSDLRALKVQHVFDMANPAVFGDVRRLTKRMGVDVLINCDSEFQLDTATPALAAFGRYIDLCADDNADRAPRSRFHLPGNASYQMLDLNYLLREQPEQAQELLQMLLTRLGEGVCKPLDGQHCGPDELPEVLKNNSDAPLVLQMEVPENDSGDMLRSVFKPDATYVITGGLGGLGLSIAERMVQQGAQHVVLVGRSAPSLVAMDVIAQLGQYGASCEAMSVDVSDPVKVQEMLDSIAASKPPLRGIIHAAGVLDNGLLEHFDEKRLRGVMPAKVNGAWNLHCACAGLELDFFMMFSSLASLIGSHGQSNYSAANAFLDGLAELRKSQGLPGVSIAWGPWSEIGMAADVHNLRRLEEHGMGMIPPAKGLDLLEDILAEGRQGAIGAIPMNWQLWSHFFPYVAQLPYVSDLIPDQETTTGYARITSASLEAMAPESQLQELQNVIHRAVYQSMRLDPEHIELGVPLTAIGLDSIVALEVKSRIESNVEVVVQTNALLKGSSIIELAEQCRKQMLAGTGGESEDQPDDEGSDQAADLLERLDELSQEEVEALLSDFAADEDIKEPRSMNSSQE